MQEQSQLLAEQLECDQETLAKMAELSKLKMEGRSLKKRLNNVKYEYKYNEKQLKKSELIKEEILKVKSHVSR